jgi:cytochrome c oxidase assembly protein subunit 11
LSISVSTSLQKKNFRTGMFVFSLALMMLALGYAAVPLYEAFCRITGFGGTTQVADVTQADQAEENALALGQNTISIRFDGSTSREMPWTFRPLQYTDTIRVGIRDMAIYQAKNNSAIPITGTATFNVEPEQAGRYFNKIQCFCFTEQTLQPGEEVTMPVLYFIDPAMLNDESMEGVEQITLSYTFHKALNQNTPS